MNNLLTSPTSLCLWHEVIKHAENRCAVSLKEDLEAYLVSLLMRYINKPEVVKQIFAKTFLEALEAALSQRQVSMQHVGDQCLLFAGLFPRAAEKKHVKINYFVNLGRSAYSVVSTVPDDLFSSLALKFVVLTDVLQSIRQYHDLLPLEAYDQWNELGSQRALKILREFSSGTPLKRRS